MKISTKFKMFIYIFLACIFIVTGTLITIYVDYNITNYYSEDVIYNFAIPISIAMILYAFSLVFILLTCYVWYIDYVTRINKQIAENLRRKKAKQAQPKQE